MEKVLVNIYVPFIEKEYELFIPVNRKISIIKKLICKSIVELSDNNYRVNNTISLSNKENNYIYADDDFVIDTDIRNGTKLILM